MKKNMCDLSTTYLGLGLRSPLVVSSNPVCKDIGNLRRRSKVRR